MFSHVTIAVSDLHRAVSFYDKALEPLGVRQCYYDAEKRIARYRGADRLFPQLMLVEPFNGAAANPGNGPMMAFQCESRKQVDELHELALTLGARDEGEPGPRERYHENFYGGYVRDLDGNKVCFVCHDPAWVGSR
ncbi:VOC family protein [Pseudooceanicola sp. MF1-13]|uniref:VOC family protein n=1 Tax=Pseudooceanicola sp. MF1-13 TaxID=3379095 RepID=UPI00389250AE